MIQCSHRPCDPWEILGDEAMVAWDRDVAPLLTTPTSFEVYDSVLDDSEGASALVYIRGMPMGTEDRMFSASAAYLPQAKRWVSTMAGWRPRWHRRRG